MFVVVSVSINDGVAVSVGAIGPFDTEDKAYEWANANWGTDTDWLVSIVSSPDMAD